MYEWIRELIKKSDVDDKQKEQFDFVNDSNKELFDKVMDLYRRN